jgi:hypothetical protein
MERTIKFPAQKATRGMKFFCEKYPRKVEPARRLRRLFIFNRLKRRPH